MTEPDPMIIHQGLALSSSFLKKCFSENGLSFLGLVAKQDLSRDTDFFSRWISDGNHASMKYLSDNEEVRSDLSRVLPDVRSVMCFALSYQKSTGPFPRIAGYAQTFDYHKIMKKLAEKVLNRLKEAFPELQTCTARVCVDTAPVPERSYACASSSSGIIGKNSMFIQPGVGSFLLLGEILLTVDLRLTEDVPPENTSPHHVVKTSCGPCRRCQVHCPTGALSLDYQVDSRLCLSYWTIEHRGVIPQKFWPYLKKYWYGCDICQDVCPFNRVQSKPLETSHNSIHKGVGVDLLSVVMMTEEEYRTWFGGTAMTRAKREGLSRNALIAMWASQDLRLQRAIDFADRSESLVLRETAAMMR